MRYPLLLLPISFVFCACSERGEDNSLAKALLSEDTKIMNCSPQPVIDIEPGPLNSNPSLFINTRNKVYFSAQKENAHALFEFDKGTEIAQEIKFDKSIGEKVWIQSLHLTKEDLLIALSKNGVRGTQLYAMSLENKEFSLLSSLSAQKLCSVYEAEESLLHFNQKIYKYVKGRLYQLAESSVECLEMKKIGDRIVLAHKNGIEFYKERSLELEFQLKKADFKGADFPHNLVGREKLLYFKAMEGSDYDHIYRYDMDERNLEFVAISDKKSSISIEGDELLYSSLDPKGQSLLKTKAIGLPLSQKELSGEPGEGLTHMNAALDVVRHNGRLLGVGFHAQAGQEILELNLNSNKNEKRVLFDLYKGKKSSYPSNFLRIGENLFFTATTAEYGAEFYKLENCAEPKEQLSFRLIESNIE